MFRTGRAREKQEERFTFYVANLLPTPVRDFFKAGNKSTFFIPRRLPFRISDFEFRIFYIRTRIDTKYVSIDSTGGELL